MTWDWIRNYNPTTTGVGRDESLWLVADPFYNIFEPVGLTIIKIAKFLAGPVIIESGVLSLAPFGIAPAIGPMIEESSVKSLAPFNVQFQTSSGIGRN